MPHTDPSKKREYDAAYYASNRTRLRDKQRNYYAANEARLKSAWRARCIATPETELLRKARERAAKYGLPFDLTAADLIVPPTCPVLGIPLLRGEGNCGPNSPSLDRLNPLLGYVRGNVSVISHRANTIKNDATPDELAAVLKWVNEQVKVNPNK